MAEKFIGNIKSKLSELRKEYFPTSYEIEENKRIETEKQKEAEEKRIRETEENNRLEEEKRLREGERIILKEKERQAEEERQRKKEEQRYLKESKRRQAQEERKQLMQANSKLSLFDLLQTNLPKNIKVSLLTKYHKFTMEEAQEFGSVAKIYLRKSPEDINNSNLSIKNKLIILTKVNKINRDKKNEGLIENLRVLNQKELTQDKLRKLKEDYERLIELKEQLSQNRFKRKYALINKLRDLRIEKKKSPNSFCVGLIEKKIEKVQTEIGSLHTEFIRYRERDGVLSEKIKIAERKIEGLRDALSSDKFMTNAEIKNKLLKEEKNRLRIERLRDEARKEIFEKEFKKIPEDEKIRFISEEVKEFVWRRDQGKCIKCGSNEKLEFDHIIPFSKGGSNTARNIQLLCEKCNRSKRDNI